MKKITLRAAFIALIAVIGFNAQAVPVDLSGWTAEGGSSNWTVAGSNDEVFQSVNGNPTVFFDPTSTGSQGTALSGNITVQSTSDDDFIGFVLGYNSGEMGSDGSNAGADFFLIDWKQGDQGAAVDGLAISHITGAVDADPGLWAHSGAGMNEIQRGNSLGSTGWADNTEYEFSILFTDSLIEVMVDGILEISITAADAGLAAFDDGAFGFYNYSQASVLYSAITSVDCNVTPDAQGCNTVSVPEPGILALIGIGFLGFSQGSKSRKRST